MSDEIKPGMPTVEQVRGHAYGIGGWGLWRYNRLNGAVSFVRLRIGVDGGVEASDGPFQGWYTLECDGCCNWTPCDQQGNPVGLLAELNGVSKARDGLYETVKTVSAERNTLHDRLSQAARRVLELGREARYAGAAERKAVLMEERRIRRINKLVMVRAGAERRRRIAEQERDTARAQLEEAQRTIAELRVEVAQADCERDYANSARVDERSKAQQTIAELRERAEREEWEDTYHSTASERDDALEALRQEEKESARLRAANEEYAERCRANQATIGRLETDLALLGGPDTPEGKALRALVRAASAGLERGEEDDWTEREDDLRAGISNVIIDAGQETEAAAWLAVLLARREPPPGQPHERDCPAPDDGHVTCPEPVALQPTATEETPAVIIEELPVAVSAGGGFMSDIVSGVSTDDGFVYTPKVVKRLRMVEVKEPERRTCGACLHNVEMTHTDPNTPRYYVCAEAAARWVASPDSEPPDDCPGFEPRDP